MRFLDGFELLRFHSRMRTALWVTVGMVLIGACGGVGPAGPQGPPGPAGEDGAGGGVTFATDTQVTWKGVGSGELATVSLSGRAGMPSSARMVLARFDVCRYVPLSGAANSEFEIGNPTNDRNRMVIIAALDCQQDASDVPRDWTSAQLWVQMDAAQSFQIGATSLGSGSSSARYRLTVLAWVP